eukprot:CAMPEP_0204514086 /NCGR_PEP_ID=MMETSP0661-20131031/1870_1 /ASSEMBLY_ACC=CAM_ASM_000606 /TAXON_ID=109239 /ORGANISM="Alexandrium margalefi, Strain AMGDE01CS-322" /LENGTH=65 /DNA_ID=CAMNT_0051519311 /DNA_START=1 /DNA_END=198 /DNA_ORIENTATION=+
MKVDSWGDTALHDAAGSGHVDVVAMLMEHRANPAQASEDGETPIDKATKKGHGDTVGVLLRRSAE